MNRPSIESLIQQARQLLEANADPASVLAVLQPIDRSNGDGHAWAQRLRALAEFRLGRYEDALRSMGDSVFTRPQVAASLTSYLQLVKLTQLTPLSCAIIAAGIMGQAQAAHPLAVLINVLRELGFIGDAPLKTKQLIFEKLICPLVRWALESGRTDFAMELESFCYAFYIKAAETEDHFAKSSGALNALMIDGGRIWHSLLPPVSVREIPGKRKIAFFIHSASTLAHIEALLSFFKGYRQLAEQPFEPIITSFLGKSEEMERLFGELGIQVVNLTERFPETAERDWQRVLKMRGWIASEGIVAVVWVTAVLGMALAFTARIAPVQIWLAMKYHAAEIPEIDGYITGGSFGRFRTIGTRVWRTGVLGVDDWYDPSLHGQAKAIRAQFGDRVVLGTMAREEKIADPEYLDMVVKILARHPNTVFLWTGRNADPSIETYFKSHNVAERTKFINWVNTRLYAQVFDLFLDTVPFPCGFTLCQALAAGMPAVISTSKESLHCGLWGYLQPLIDGAQVDAGDRRILDEIYAAWDRRDLFFVRTSGDYLALASELIENPDLRERAGRAARILMQRFFSDPSRMGRTISDHLMEIVDEKLGAAKTS